LILPEFWGYIEMPGKQLKNVALNTTKNGFIAGESDAGRICSAEEAAEARRIYTMSKYLKNSHSKLAKNGEHSNFFTCNHSF
jgi:hypothetical protein